MSIFETITQKKEELTKKQRTVAEYMLNNSDEMAYITLKDLSRKIKVTEITILNTCLALGYDSFNSVKYEFRKSFVSGLKTNVIDEKNNYIESLPEYELGDNEKFLRSVCDEEIKMLEDYCRNIDLKKIFEAAELFFKYEKIIICGRGFSYVMGEQLQSYLAYSDIFSSLVNTELNDSAYSMLSCIKKDTLLVVISFPDYYFMTTKIAQFAREESEAKIIAITDKNNSEVTCFADLVLTAPSMTRMFLNTLSGVMIMLNLLGTALKLIKDSREKEK